MTTKKQTTWQVAMTRMSCSGCGVIYDLTEDYFNMVYRGGVTWYCPNGHTQSYTQTAADREREKREQAEAALAEARGSFARLSTALDSERKSHSATKGKLTKTRKRIEAGLCPDCNRHFMNLQGHMETQHTATP